MNCHLNRRNKFLVFPFDFYQCRFKMVLNARCFTLSILASAMASNFVGLSSSTMVGNIKDG
jgi:hypothetical protein